MRNFVRRHGATFLVALVTAAVTAGAPAVAASIADYAKNADRIDGRHAVGAGASRADRAGKLVATNANGVLPNNIIAKAGDAEKLDGLDGLAYQKRVSGTCEGDAFISSITETGAVGCEEDNVDGGNAQSLQGLDASAYQRRISQTCAAGQKMTGASADGLPWCSTDNVDGGNATTLDNLDSADLQKKYARTVLVSPTGTPAANGTALRSAINGITTASATNPWLVKLEPGVYTVTESLNLDMKPFVDVEGSGPLSLITCACDAFNTGATVVMAADSAIRDLTVETTGGTSPAVAVYVPGTADRALVEDAIVVASSSGAAVRGIQTEGDAVVFEDVDVEVTGASPEAYGIAQYSAAAVSEVRGGTIDVVGNNAYGMAIAQGTQHVRGTVVSSSATTTAMALTLQGGATGSFSDGVVSALSGTSLTAASLNDDFTIDRASLMAGTGKAIDLGSGGNVRIGGSKLEGTTSVASGGAVACAATYRVPHYVLTNAACGTP